MNNILTHKDRHFVDDTLTGEECEQICCMNGGIKYHTESEHLKQRVIVSSEYAIQTHTSEYFVEDTVTCAEIKSISCMNGGIKYHTESAFL